MNFSAQDLTDIRKALSERRSVLEESCSALERPEFRSFFESSENPSTAEIPSQLLADTLQSLNEQLEDVTGAEFRLASGSFGVCQQCGHALSHATLRDSPEARFCGKCAR